MLGKGSIYVRKRVNIFQVKGQYMPEKLSIYVRKRVNTCYSACNGYVFRKSTTLIQYGRFIILREYLISRLNHFASKRKNIKS